VLRLGPSGSADQLPALLERATKGPLSYEEAQIIAQAIRNQEPWLEWAGEREKKTFEVHPVAQPILKVLGWEDVQRDFFADPQLEYQKAVQFYQHDVDGSNRMILGDSVDVMASLVHREGVAARAICP